MILQNPLTIDLGIGTDRRMIQPADANVLIPPTILPTVAPLVPLATNPSTVAPCLTSFAFEYDLNANNQAAVNDLICTFGKGLWEIMIGICDTLVMATAFSAAQRYRYYLADGTQIFPLFTRPLVSGTSFFQTFPMRFLFRNDTQLHIDLPATAAGDTVTILAPIIGNKLI